jgi:DNA helicase II / ATP-dependent DNA helicase PcrA
MTLADDAAPSGRRPNPEQRTVIGHDHGPIRVMAGAGTGKTHTLTERVARLIGDGLARPDQILALAFNNKASAELRDRIGEACLALGVSPDAEPVTVLTYHGFGNSVIGEWGGMIGLPPSPPLLSDAESWLLLWDCLPRVDFRSIDLMYLRSQYGSPMKPILDLGSRLKDELVTPRELQEYLENGSIDDPVKADTLADYVRALLIYESERTARGVIEFGDQIALAVRALQLAEVRAAYHDRYRFVLVDEYQDTNYAQSVMVQLLVQDWPQQNVCVVGDIRQAIYRFRGAAPDNLMRFPQDFAAAQPYSLRRNYRSTEQILDVANAIWVGGSDDGDDLVSADNRQGPSVIACSCEDPESEWEWIARRIRAEHERGVAYRDMAVLLRKNEPKRQVWRGLLDRGIPAVMTGGSDLYRTPEVGEILSYLRSLARPSDNVSLAHIASSDSFGLDEAALYDLIGPLPRGRSLFDLLVERAADPSAPNDLRLFLATFSRLLSDTATLSPARVVERVIGLRRGAYTNLQQTNVYRFQGIAEDFASHRLRGVTVSSFVAYLNLLLAAPSDETEATDVIEEDAVQVLTVHSAKGLERSVIFVATASEQDFTLPNHSDPLPPALRHSAAGMPTADDFPDERRYKKALETWEKGQHRLEEQRIAYVALTRAKDRLYISWHRLPLSRNKERRPLDVLQHALPLTVEEQFNRSDWDGEEQQPAAPDLLARARRFAKQQAKLWAAWRPDDFDENGATMAERLAGAWEQYGAEEGDHPAGEDLLQSGIQRWRAERRRVESLLGRCLTPALRPPDADRRPVVDVPTTLSYSMLATYQDCSRKAYLRFLAGFPGEPRPGVTGPGTAFHAAVETVATAEQAGRESSFDDLLASFREAAAEAHGVTLYTVSEPERTMLRSFWEGPDRLATALYVEAEFYWRVGPGYLHGFIDRIQRNADGTIELIDFKTSRQAMSESDARESLQLLIYALASHEVYGVAPDRLTLVYPRLNQRVSVSFSDEELRTARMTIVNLMERARTASYDDVDTRHCPMCEYRLICPAASLFR